MRVDGSQMVLCRKLLGCLFRVHTICLDVLTPELCMFILITGNIK
jgi:hypothetical protein